MREFAARPSRAPIEMQVDLKSGNESFAATSKNLGVGGMFVATDRQLPVGDRVTVELSLPGHIRPMAIGAEVRWIQPSGDRSAGMGLRFVRPSFGVTVAIHGLLQNLSSG
ncbi:MAG TPA: TIGR02266 family protein [Polyangia bacterium]